MTIAKQLLDDVEARIIAIVTAGEGSSGYSAQAAALSIPAGRFRLPPGIGMLRDDGLSTEAFDRAVEIEWVSLASDPDPYNSQDAVGLRRVRWRLHVGYLFGKEMPTTQIHVASGTSETAANALKYARRRALSDAETLAGILSIGDVVKARSHNAEIVIRYLKDYINGQYPS